MRCHGMPWSQMCCEWPFSVPLSSVFLWLVVYLYRGFVIEVCSWTFIRETLWFFYKTVTTFYDVYRFGIFAVKVGVEVCWGWRELWGFETYFSKVLFDVWCCQLEETETGLREIFCLLLVKNLLIKTVSRLYFYNKRTFYILLLTFVVANLKKLKRFTKNYTF